MQLSFASQPFTVFFLWLTIPPWLAAFLFSFSYIQKKTREFRIFFLLTFACNILLFFTNNWFTFLTVYETLTLCSLPLVFHDRNHASVIGGKWYFYFSLLSGILLFGSIILEYAQSTLPETMVWLPLALRVIGLLIKCGAFPFHVWLPEAHPVAPSPASAILSGSIIKIGFYGLIRVTTESVIPTFFGTGLLWLSVVTMLYAVIYALLQSNIKKMLAFHSVSQMGYVLLGLAAFWLFRDEVAFIGSLLHAMNHAYFKSALFIMAGIQYLSYHSLNMYEIKGFFRREPILSIFFFIAVLGISGVPFFNGYISKIFLHEELVGHPSLSFHWIESIFLLTAIGTFASNMKWFSLSLFRKEIESSYQPVLRQAARFFFQGLPLLILCFFILIIGIFPVICESFLPTSWHLPAHHLLEEVLPFHHLFTHSLEGFFYILLAGIAFIYTGLRQHWFHYHPPAWFDVKSWWIVMMKQGCYRLFHLTQIVELGIVKLFSLISYRLAGLLSWDAYLENKIAHFYQLCYRHPIRLCKIPSSFESRFQENLFISINPQVTNKTESRTAKWVVLSEEKLFSGYRHFYNGIRYLFSISHQIDQTDSDYYDKIIHVYGKTWSRWLLVFTIVLTLIFLLVAKRFFP